MLGTVGLSRLTVCLGISFSFVVGTLLASAQGQEISTQEPAIQPTSVQEAQAEEAKAEQPNFEAGPVPQWIWGAADGEKSLLRKSFPGGAKSAHLIATCDNKMQVDLNGKRVATSSEWQSPVVVDVTQHLVDGENKLQVLAENDGGAKAFALKLVLTMPNGEKTYVVSDASWQSVARNNTPLPVDIVGKMGDGPWNNVFSGTTLTAQAERDVFNVLPGFQVELLYTVPKDVHGSWVSITFDDKGRLIASDQGDKGLYRITPAKGEEPTKIEKLDVKMTGCQGMLHAFGKLYCSVNGGPGSGFYILEDTNG
ncbi:MAG: hypothetical protein WD045_09680, partial [Pirellulaceae bacterium]